MNTDVIQELRQLMGPLDPAAPHRISDQRLEASAAPVPDLLRRASSYGPDRRIAGNRRARRWALVGAVAILAGGSLAAAKLLNSTPAAAQAVVRCYTVASLTEDASQFTDTATASVPGQTAPDISATVAAAVDACAALWRIGLLQNGRMVPEALASPGTYPVPQLTACVLPDGLAAVLPGDDQTCHVLGLPRLADRH
jgi:hypothetical protein